MNQPPKEQRTVYQTGGPATPGFVTLKKSQVQMADAPGNKSTPLNVALTKPTDQFNENDEQKLCGCNLDCTCQPSFHRNLHQNQQQQRMAKPNFYPSYWPAQKQGLDLSNDKLAFEQETESAAADDAFNEHYGDDCEEDQYKQISMGVEQVLIANDDCSPDTATVRGDLNYHLAQRSQSPAPSEQATPQLPSQHASSFFKNRYRADSDPTQGALHLPQGVGSNSCYSNSVQPQTEPIGRMQGVDGGQNQIYYQGSYFSDPVEYQIRQVDINKQSFCDSMSYDFHMLQVHDPSPAPGGTMLQGGSAGLSNNQSLFKAIDSKDSDDECIEQPVVNRLNYLNSNSSGCAPIYNTHGKKRRPHTEDTKSPRVANGNDMIFLSGGGIEQQFLFGNPTAPPTEPTQQPQPGFKQRPEIYSQGGYPAQKIQMDFQPQPHPHPSNFSGQPAAQPQSMYHYNEIQQRLMHNEQIQIMLQSQQAMIKLESDHLLRQQQFQQVGNLQPQSAQHAQPPACDASHLYKAIPVRQTEQLHLKRQMTAGNKCAPFKPTSNYPAEKHPPQDLEAFPFYPSAPVASSADLYSQKHPSLIQEQQFYHDGEQAHKASVNSNSSATQQQMGSFLDQLEIQQKFNQQSHQYGLKSAAVHGQQLEHLQVPTSSAHQNFKGHPSAKKDKQAYSQKSKISTTTTTWTANSSSAHGGGQFKNSENHNLQNYLHPQAKTSLSQHTNSSGNQYPQSTSSQPSQHELQQEKSSQQFATTLIQKLDACEGSQKQKIALLKDNVFRLACTQPGSRHMQKELAKADSHFVEFILSDIGKNLAVIMVDRYGNYFCQKLLQNVTIKQRSQVLQLIKADFTKICCDQRGTHTVQSILDNIELTLYEEFVKQTLQGKVFDLSVDQQGTHVIQKLISKPQQANEAFERIFDFIFAEVQSKIHELCLNKNGLCVIKIIVAGIQKTEQKDHILLRMSREAVVISCDPFGNYAITEIITRWPESCGGIFEHLRTNLSELCNQKYSSNVLEKCFEYAPERIRSQFIMELVSCERLPNLIKNSFGNYVIQKSLDVAYGDEKDALVVAIQKCIPAIQDKKIRTKWQNIILKNQELTQMQNVQSLSSIAVEQRSTQSNDNQMISKKNIQKPQQRGGYTQAKASSLDGGEQNSQVRVYQSKQASTKAKNVRC